MEQPGSMELPVTLEETALSRVDASLGPLLDAA